MSRREEITNRIIDSGAVAVIRLPNTDDIHEIVQAVLDGGISSIEVTMTVPGCLQAITALRQSLGDQCCLGVGSVMNAKDARAAVDAGAEYVVSPVLLPEVIKASHDAGVPTMPGCFTPTELQTAHSLGAEVLKVFPANILGMGFFKAALAPMPHLRLMPTGGVNLDNPGDWLRAGAVAVGVGSALLNKKAIAERNFAVLTENAQRIQASIQSARS